MPNTQTGNYSPTRIYGGAAGPRTTFLKTDTSFSVLPGDGAQLPPAPFYMTIGENGSAVEKVKVTATSGDTLTVQRAQQNTPAVSWPKGTRVEYDTLAGNLANLWGAVTDVQATVNSLPGGQSASSTVASLATSGTIATAGVGVARITTTGAVTGAILAAGTATGQLVLVVNESANTVTFNATAATGKVASGAEVIAANTAAHFVWDNDAGFWFRVK